MVNAQEKLFDRASQFFKGMEGSIRLTEHLKDVDQIIQFAPKDGQPFHVQIAKGRVNVGEGKKYQDDSVDALYVTGDEASLDALLKGEISVAESIYHQKIQIAGYRNKEPQIVGFSRLLRLGAWALVQGSPLLMPER